MSLSGAMHKRADCVVIAAPLEEVIHPDTLCILVEPQAVDLAGRQRKRQFTICCLCAIRPELVLQPRTWLPTR